MKVLVIGGAGYIGSHVVLELLEKGHQPGVFDNLSSGKKENLREGVPFFEANIMKPEDLDKVLEQGWDAAIHLAAFKAAGESMTAPEKYSVNNISGSINILNALTRNQVKKLVFSSSAAVYGSPQYLPMNEDHPCLPENYYGFTKLEIERIMAWYDQLKGLKFAALRYFNAAGYDPQGRITGLESNPANLLPIVMEAAAGLRPKVQIFGKDYPTPDGTCLRDYIHVSDLAQAHVMALDHLEKTQTSFEVNLGTGKGISVVEMVEMARKITGQAIPSEFVGRRAGDPAEIVASAAKALEVLGWKAKHSSVNELIETTWKVYQKNLQKTKGLQ